MMELLEFKEKLKALYARFGAFAGPAIKFLLGFLSVVMLNQNLGFMARIDNMPAALFLGIVCMALPYGGMALLAGIVMLAHITAVSLELAAIVLALLLAVLVVLGLWGVIDFWWLRRCYSCLKFPTRFRWWWDWPEASSPLFP